MTTKESSLAFGSAEGEDDEDEEEEEADTDRLVERSPGSGVMIDSAVVMDWWIRSMT